MNIGERCSKMVAQPGMAFYRPRQCQRMAVMRENGVPLCACHQPIACERRERRRAVAHAAKIRLGVAMQIAKLKHKQRRANPT